MQEVFTGECSQEQDLYKSWGSGAGQMEESNIGVSVTKFSAGPMDVLI